MKGTIRITYFYILHNESSKPHLYHNKFLDLHKITQIYFKVREMCRIKEGKDLGEDVVGYTYIVII